MKEILISTAKYACPFILGLIVKSLLDFEAAAFLVKHLHWFPTRTIFRKKEIKLAGMWEYEWEVQSSSYPALTDRHGQTQVKQLFKYCYAEFYSRGEKYIFFGKLSSEYIVGRWYDAKDENGYFGTYELYIKNSNNMTGKWIGHSKEKREINTGSWSWRKLPK